MTARTKIIVRIVVQATDEVELRKQVTYVTDNMTRAVQRAKGDMSVGFYDARGIRTSAVVIGTGVEYPPDLIPVEPARPTKEKN